MKITIELDTKKDKDTYDFLRKKVSEGDYYLQLDPLNTGKVGWYNLYGMTTDYNSYGYNCGSTVTLEICSCAAPKSKEQLAAEIVVAKAKEALKAAEENLKLFAINQPVKSFKY